MVTTSHRHRGMTVPDPVATASPHRQSQTRTCAADSGDAARPSRQRRNPLPRSRHGRSNTTHWSSVTRSAIRNLATVGPAILRRTSEGAEADLVGGTRMSVALGDAAALVENVLRCQPLRGIERINPTERAGLTVILAVVRQSVQERRDIHKLFEAMRLLQLAVRLLDVLIQAEAARQHQETAGNR
jgi:hypothetical protein